MVSLIYLFLVVFPTLSLSFTHSPRLVKTSSTALTKMSGHKIEIVPVKCQDDEHPALRGGVTELFKLYFDELYELGCDLGFQGFQSEWTDLPGKYDFNKRGGLFVAVALPANDETPMHEVLKDSAQVVGCIAIRPLDDKCGEVKRMYTRKSHRRYGVGRMLSETIISHAWDLGYSEIKLDSLERLNGAVKLYENMGFERIDPYCECPEDDHVCMNLFKSEE